MSCISGVGGKVAPLVRKAQSGRPMLVIDGCHLHCAKSCLENVGVEIPEGHHVNYTNWATKKRFGKSYDEATVEEVYQYVLTKKGDVLSS